MIIDIDFISGFMVGLEVYNDPFFGQGLIIDLGIIRFTFDWSKS